MKTFKGIPVAPGFAEGNARIYGASPGASAVQKRKIAPEAVGNETARFEAALEASIEELKALRGRVLGEIGETEAGIFEVHLTLLGDLDFTERIKQRLHKDLVNVEHAIAAEIDDLETLLKSVESDYLRERHQDIRDVGERLLRHLISGDSGFKSLRNLPPNSIVVAHQLLPSDTLEMNRKNVAGIATEHGGSQSHAAILARSLGIPSVTGIDKLVHSVRHGDELLIDANSGTLTVAPTPECRQAFTKSSRAYSAAISVQTESAKQECLTRDGTACRLHANIGRLDELPSVREGHLAGVGLFRTEYLFLSTPEPPSLSQQAPIYRRALRELKGLPVVIRTADLGGDKCPAFLEDKLPCWSARGLQFSLHQKTWLRTQLRALLRASPEGDLLIIFPMVVGVDDFRRALQEVQRAGEKEGLSQLPKVGAMIETPAAIFQIDEILAIADFVSIGTNDLTQFLLAVDRRSLEAANHLSTLHPSVLRAVKYVIDRARAAGKPCSVCGEAAGDPAAACLLMGLGICDLSMSPVLTARVRHKLRHQQMHVLEEAAERALNASTAREVSDILQTLP